MVLTVDNLRSLWWCLLLQTCRWSTVWVSFKLFSFSKSCDAIFLVDGSKMSSVDHEVSQIRKNTGFVTKFCTASVLEGLSQISKIRRVSRSCVWNWSKPDQGAFQGLLSTHAFKSVCGSRLKRLFCTCCFHW